jgi:pimeloyl-ACP methyl ester carboxylesterase
MVAEEIQFIDVDGYRLAYVEAGADSPALLLIHGSMSDYRSWVNQMVALSARHRTIAVSLRHCYPERWDGTGDDFSVEQHADDLVALVARMGLRSAHVVGHSRGGAVALQLALQHPDAVRTLVLADPGGLEALLPDTPEGAKMARETQQMFARLRQNLEEADAETAAREFAEALSGPGAWERRTPEQRQVMLDNIRTGPASAQRPQFTAAQVSSIAVPILSITGTGSPPRYRLLFERMRSLNSNVSPLVTIANAAHAMQRDNPADFNAAVLEFISGTTTTRAS